MTTDCHLSWSASRFDDAYPKCIKIVNRLSHDLPALHMLRRRTLILCFRDHFT
jgi:hypothetical protein